MEIDKLIDDVLYQEIISLREKLKLSVSILKFYIPELDENIFMHSLNEDFALYQENNNKSHHFCGYNFETCINQGSDLCIKCKRLALESDYYESIGKVNHVNK